MKCRLAAVAVVLVGCQTGVPAPGSGGTERSGPAGRATPMRMVASTRVAPTDVAAPWTLTASDGSGLELTQVDARAVIEGPLAFTELHLHFHNPEARTREGTFVITLPPGAAVSRFAMENAGAWQEAEVVEKMAARRAYDDFLHRRQDPALLEKAAGNQFSARVFPIPANADKHLVLSFSQELVGRDYALPLRGLPKTARVEVQLDATQLDGTRRRQTLSERDWLPDRDFVAAVVSSAAAVAHGELVVGALAFADGDGVKAAPEIPRTLTLLVDTSASRALGFRGYVASVRGVIAALREQYGDPIALQVVAFDQDTQLVYEGLAGGYGDAHDQVLLARGAAGASDLGQALATLAGPAGPARRRVVVVTDGVVTAGPDTPALVAAIARLPIDRLDVVLAGGIRDQRMAASLVRAGLPRAGDVHDLDDGATAVAAGLGEPVIADIAIEVPGATWVYPRTIPAARPGSTLMVYARMARPSPSIEVVIGGARRTIVPGAATPALLERAIAGAEIEELENQLEATADDAAARALRDDIATRSVAARVLSSQTSMLVLESDEDYARYKIERTALADILIVGPDGIEETHRAAPPPPPPEEIIAQEQARQQVVERAATQIIARGFEDIDVHGDVHGGLLGNDADEIAGGFGFGRSGFGPGGGGTGWGTIGTGRYGTIGHGSGTGSGYGVGSGRGGMRGRSSTVPSVRLGQPSVGGDLDRAILRRYIKRNLQKLQYCYEKELLIKPALHGVVVTRFVISPGGQVANGEASGMDTNVAACIAAVVRTIQFPAPRSGGLVQVTYPLTFERVTEPDEPAEPEQPAPDPEPEEEQRGGPPLTGKLAEIMKAVAARQTDKALRLARAWHDEAPGDVLALIALGEALEANRDVAAAARIYGSIIDLFSSRADLRRFAGERLERLGAPARALAIDTYRRAVADRPDHVSAHRLLAYALVRHGDLAAAFAAILAGIDQAYPDNRFPGADRILADDAGMIAAAYLAAGGPRDQVTSDLTRRSLAVATKPSTRFLMYWETDANDVDFHIRDRRGGHAWYSDKTLASGGELYADITTGYGPECFAIEGTPTAGPYKLSINYYSQGPMGYGMGLLQIQQFDGKAFTFEDRPYVIMTDHAFVDLGTFGG